MTKKISVTESEIPLYLLPKAISGLIRKLGTAVYRISVKRTHWHHYNISVRTKAIRKELATVPVAVLEADPVLPENSRRSRRTARGCAA